MKKLFAILMILLFYSCDEQLPAVLPGFESVIVSNSFIRPDTTISTFLSTNVSTLSRENPAPVTGARIQLFEDDFLVGSFYETELVASERSFLGTRSLMGVYRIDYQPQVGKAYRIEVVHDDYAGVSAQTEIPAITSYTSVSLSDPVVISYDGAFRDDEPSIVQYQATVTIKDAPGRNYYEIAVFQEVPRRTNRAIGDSAVIRYDVVGIAYTSDNILFEEGDNPAYLGDAGEVFTDDLFTDQEFSIDITFTLQVGANAQSCCPREIITAIESFYIEVRSLSEDYYEYQYTSSLEQAVTDPFAEPVQVYSNITGGLGIFGGYNVERFDFSLEEFIPEE